MVAVTKAGGVRGKTEAANRSIHTAPSSYVIRSRLIQAFCRFRFFDIGFRSLTCIRVALIFHSMSDVRLLLCALTRVNPICVFSIRRAALPLLNVYCLSRMSYFSRITSLRSPYFDSTSSVNRITYLRALRSNSISDIGRLSTIGRVSSIGRLSCSSRLSTIPRAPCSSDLSCFGLEFFLYLIPISHHCRNGLVCNPKQRTRSVVITSANHHLHRRRNLRRLA